MPRRPVDVAPEALAGDRSAALKLVALSATEQERLQMYVDLLLRWQTVLNLVSPSTLPAIWTRHIADCAQLRDLAPEALTWADLGSGGGFPGLVVAILLRGRPGSIVHLIERDRRKAAFLQAVSRETGVSVHVHVADAASILPRLPNIEVVTSRALAPLATLLTWSRPVLERGARGLYLKGQSVEEEIAALPEACWDLSTLPSRSNASGRIVSVRYKAEFPCDSGRAFP